MIYNKFNINILFRLFCFGVTAAALTYFVLVQFIPLLAIFLIIVLIFEAFSFVRFFNAVNRKLSYFFDAIRNEDSTLKFSENVKNKSLLGLHKSLNDVNKVISEVKIKNETNERFLKELIEHSTTGLMSIDPDGYVEVMNRQAKKYLSIVNLSNIHLLQQINPSVYNVLKTIKPGEKIILKQIIKNNPVNLSFQSSELCFGEKRYQLISLQDIRHELEENEIDSWQKLIRVMTHEIMNSIAPITSLTHTLIRFFKSGEKVRLPEELTAEDIHNTLSGLAVIEDRGKGLMHFVDNYRKLTKIPNPVFEPMNIHTWSDSFEFLFRSEFLENNWVYQRQIDSSLDTVLTDEKLFGLVMINLMTNAMDAIRQNTPDNPGKISLSIRSSASHTVLFELSDNGCGISESQLDKIFIPFFSTKEGGNGIGLSLSRQIVRKLNGKISVKSLEYHGSRFIVEI